MGEIMTRISAIPLVLLIPLFGAGMPCIAADARDETALYVARHGGSYELSVPVSRLVMTVPQANFSRSDKPGSGAAHSRRHFLFEDKKQGLIVSGWFEPASSYSNFDKIWHDEKASWQSENLPAPANETRFKSGGWDAVAYDLVLQDGAANSPNIRAFWVEAGTWIDLHLSSASTATPEEQRRRLVKLLESIRVSQRP